MTSDNPVLRITDSNLKRFNYNFDDYHLHKQIYRMLNFYRQGYFIKNSIQKIPL